MENSKTKIQIGIDHIAKHPGCRTDALAAAMDTDTKNVIPAINDAIKAGLIVTCKVERPGKAPMNEFRLSSSAPANPDWREWKRTHAPSHVVAKPQPAEGKISPAAEDRSAPLRHIGEASAVAAPPAPETSPAAAAGIDPQENAGGCNRATTIRLQIDNDGTLLIDAGDGIIELAPSETRELGQFMIDTEPVWA